MKLNVDSYLVQMFRDNFGTGWTIEDDRRFWTRIQGRRGLRRLRRDARALERLCKRLSASPNDLEFMKYRLWLMSVCIRFSDFEGAARIIYRKLPHFFARFAAELFSEMLDRAELITEEKLPQFLKTSGEADGQANHTVANSAPAGRTPARAAGGAP